MLRVSSRSTRLFTAPSSSRHLSALQCAPQNRRTFGTAPSARSSDEDSGASKGPEARRAGGGGRTNTVRGYRHWLQTEGRQWKNPTKPKNWLGGDVPFPMNKTFKPPTPISDSLRNSVYTMHMANPVANDARSIATQFGLSIKRVEAIIKLKTLEATWKQKKQLQTGFVQGMEVILGVTEDARTLKAVATAVQHAQLTQPQGTMSWPEVQSASRMNTQAADMQVQDEGEQGIRDRERYRRMYWESVGDGEEPVVPEQLEKTREEARQRRENLRKTKSDPVLLAGLSTPRLRAQGRKKTVVVERSNRPAIKFVDVGGKFLDVEKASKRVRTAE